MTRRLLPAEQARALLAETPPRIEAMAAGVVPGPLRATPQPDEWSANEVLAHLRACADVPARARSIPHGRAVGVGAPRGKVDQAACQVQELRSEGVVVEADDERVHDGAVKVDILALPHA